MNVEIKTGSIYNQDELNTQLIHLVYEGFQSKFTKLFFKKKETNLAIKALCNYICNKKTTNLVSSYSENQLCGCLFLTTDQEKFPDLYSSFRESLTVFQTIKLIILLKLLSYTPNKNENYIDFLVVSKKFQRQGIATSLLSYCCEQEQSKALVLYVAEDNTKAIQLYKHSGFKFVKKEKSRLLNVLIGKKGWYLMKWEKEN